MGDYRHLARWGIGLAAGLDMIDEASRILRGEADVELSGISEQVERNGGIRISTVCVLNENAAKRLGKKRGSYITIDIPPVLEQNDLGRISELTGEKLALLLPALAEDECVLLFGLGNNYATPDALGPQVVEKTFATRPLFGAEENNMRGMLRPLAALAPGVLGITGIEASEIIQGVAWQVKPAAVIVVDSLAAASLSRVGASMQITDSGISPGSGIGNRRPNISEDIIGLPVIAIGVPTVVDSKVIIYEALTKMLQEMEKQGHITPSALDYDLLTGVSAEVLRNFEGNLIVTPKDIDQLLADAAHIIAGAVAQAVHPGVDRSNYHDYLR